MYSTQIKTLLSFCIAATVFQTTAAQTPPGFTPAISTHLDVTYGAFKITPAGITVPGTSLTNAPILSLLSSQSTSYIAFLIDLSIQNNGSNTTLLHWLLPGLSGIETLNSTATALAPYAPPGPPAGQTHTYGVFLYQQPSDFAVPTDYAPFFANLTASVFNRVGFNLTKFVDEAELGEPVAADWFLVSSPSANATMSSAAGTGTATGVPVATYSAVSGAVGLKPVGIVASLAAALGCALNVF